MTLILKNREVPLKKVTWAYYNNLVCKKDSIFLNGFRKHGSIITKNLVDYDKKLDLTFDLQLYPHPQDNVALMDLDLDAKNEKFFSLIFFNNELLMIIQEKEVTKHYASNTYRDDLEWIEMFVSIDGQTISVYSDGHNEFTYTFESPLDYCTVSFGNNTMPPDQEVSFKKAFKIKNVCLTTAHGQFPLVPNELIQITDM